MKRMRRFSVCLGMLFLSAFMLTLTSCDEHEPLDLNIYPGYILCDDGRIVSPDEFFQGGRTAVAVVFAPLTDSHNVLSVLLDEVPFINFCDTLSMDQKTSCDISAYDGYTNTVALQTTWLPGKRKQEVWRDSAYVTEWVTDPFYYGSPLGLSAFRSHWFAQSDYVPSVAEMGLLYMSLDKVNPVIKMCGGDTIGVTPRDAGCWYWTSTEVEENKPNQAWLFSMADGSRHKAAKDNFYRARLIVEYNPLSIDK